MDKLAVIRQDGKSLNGCFQKTKHFLPSDMHTTLNIGYSSTVVLKLSSGDVL